MSDGLPFSRLYNLNRLGHSGDEVSFRIAEEESTGLARFADISQVSLFAARVALKKTAPNRFHLDFALEADIMQACVVSLADVPAHIERRFIRELHFNPALKRSKEPVLGEDLLQDDDKPEEIDSLHYDLAAPLIEEFVLAIDPYPRAPGIEFEAPQEAGDAPENPFAVLKGLKSGL
ncbi:MAG: DUF177 domain-containing protein [Rhizomicrobium sp.]